MVSGVRLVNDRLASQGMGLHDCVGFRRIVPDLMLTLIDWGSFETSCGVSCGWGQGIISFLLLLNLEHKILIFS